MLLDELVSIGATINVMINDTFDFRSQISLTHVEDIVIDQGNFFNIVSRWVLLSELIVEVELALVDLAVFEV